MVHIRPGTTRTSFCGVEAGESISQRHYTEHVVANAEGCCAWLWRNLCPSCREQLHSIAKIPVDKPDDGV
jgi:hypothetical protein